MTTLSRSVGEGGTNHPADVTKIQQLLNNSLYLLPDIKNKLAEDGEAGALTVAAIRAYQATVLKMSHPDGRVDPDGATLKNLQKTARAPRPANVSSFIDETLEDAREVRSKYRIPVSVLMAQAALESGWGRHVKDNAYFGIKAHNTEGATTTFTTTEYISGQKVTTEDSFRAYANFMEAALDYGAFLTTNPRYKPAFDHTNDPYKFADALQAAGYATDPQYAQKLHSIILTYYLDDYDK